MKQGGHCFHNMLFPPESCPDISCLFTIKSCLCLFLSVKGFPFSSHIILKNTLYLFKKNIASRTMAPFLLFRGGVFSPNT